jgi:hypothetical protein
VKNFEKVAVIDNLNQNSDKLSFLLDPANKNIQINFLANAKIGEAAKPHEPILKSKQPNIT